MKKVLMIVIVGAIAITLIAAQREGASEAPGASQGRPEVADDLSVPAPPAEPRGPDGRHP